MKKDSIDTDSLAHTKWDCKYHIVFAPKYRRQEIYGKIKKVIAEYIRNQLEEDYVAEQISIKEFVDPFTGNKKQ